jgi:phthiocerol/phenolphthiocerol synthesis type-I polyketide synthase B
MQDQGIPTAVVNWGLWSDTPIAGGPAIQNELRNIGVGEIPLSEAKRVFDRAVPAAFARSAQILARLDLQTFAEYYSARGAGLFARLVRTVEHRGLAGLERLNGTAQEVRAEIHGFLCEALLKITGRNRLPDLSEDIGFLDLGLDSIMALKLKQMAEQRFGIALDATLVFDYPTLFTLVDYIELRVRPSEREAPDANVHSGAEHHYLNDLSDEAAALEIAKIYDELA